jgi:hypothetical protein
VDLVAAAAVVGVRPAAVVRIPVRVWRLENITGDNTLKNWGKGRDSFFFKQWAVQLSI